MMMMAAAALSSSSLLSPRTGSPSASTTRALFYPFFSAPHARVHNNSNSRQHTRKERGRGGELDGGMMMMMMASWHSSSLPCHPSSILPFFYFCVRSVGFITTHWTEATSSTYQSWRLPPNDSKQQQTTTTTSSALGRLHFFRARAHLLPHPSDSSFLVACRADSAVRMSAV